MTGPGRGGHDGRAEETAPPEAPEQGAGADAPELDPLFAAARSIINRPGGVDVDRAITLGAARSEGRRSRRLALLRAAGLSVVVGVLIGWVLVARPAGTDVAMVVALFAIPAIAVFRWHLEAMDGCGVLPRRVGPTVRAWSHELVRRVADLDRSIADLERLGASLDGLTELLERGRPPERDGAWTFRTALAVPADEAREEVADLLGRLRAASAGSDRFREHCADRPCDADWTLMRSADPASAREQMQRVVAALSRLAALAPTLPLHDTEPVGPRAVLIANDARARAGRQLPAVAARLRKVVRAMDRLHRVASVRHVRRAPGALRPVVGGVAVLASGLRRPAPQRAAIRAVLVGAAPAGLRAWVRAVANARAAAGEAGA